MTAIEKYHAIRWLLLIPSTLGLAALALACSLVVTALLIGFVDWFIFLVFILPPSTITVIWVCTAYYIVLTHCLAAGFGAYLAGNVVMFIWFPMPVLRVAAGISGLLTCIYYVGKSNYL